MTLPRIAACLDNAARRCSVTPPDDWATSTSPEHVEMRDDCMFDAVYEILDRVDPPRPISQQIDLAGDGSSERFELPDGFRRLQRDEWAIFQIGYPTKRFIAVDSHGQFEAIKDQGSAGGDVFYFISPGIGDDDEAWISFYPVLGTGETLRINFVSDKWIYDGVAEKSSYINVLNKTFIPRLLLQAGIVYKFRQYKGLDYGDAMVEFERNLARYANTTINARVVGSAPRARRWIFDIPVPDFIPPGA